MSQLVYLAFPLVMVFGVAVPALAVRMPPHTATWMVSVGCVLAAATTGWSLTLLAFHFLARFPVVDRWWGWSQTVLAAQDPVPAWLGGVAMALLMVALTATVREFVRQARTLGQTYRLAASLTDLDLDLVVVTDAPNPAQAVPGRPGRIVVASALLAVLDPSEWVAVLAHERAHLDHRHHLHLAAVRVAAAANPVLRPLIATTGLCVEMWADREAARRSDPVVVARALVRTASRTTATPADLSAATTATQTRVRRLLDGRTGHNSAGWVPVVIVVVLAAAAILAAHDTELLFEAALRGV